MKTALLAIAALSFYMYASQRNEAAKAEYEALLRRIMTKHWLE